jgi:hypothetical protein
MFVRLHLNREKSQVFIRVNKREAMLGQDPLSWQEAYWQHHTTYWKDYTSPQRNDKLSPHLGSEQPIYLITTYLLYFPLAIVNPRKIFPPS